MSESTHEIFEQLIAEGRLVKAKRKRGGEDVYCIQPQRSLILNIRELEDAHEADEEKRRHRWSHSKYNR